MARTSTTNSGLSLYTCSHDLDGQRLRWLVAEKGVENLRLLQVEQGLQDKELLALNPRHDLPTLVERNLVISGFDIVAEYLDERYPYPSLMPSDPAGRAKLRMTIRVLRQDLELPLLETQSAKAVVAALQSLEDLLGKRKFMVGGTMTLVDVYLGPILWRLRSMGHSWPKSAPALREYAQRLGDRPAFRGSLTRRESAMGVV